METKSLKQELVNLKGKSVLKDDVINFIIDKAEDYNDIKSVFKDLLQHGCSSGMVNHLIYYKDTHEYFDKNYNEIMDLVYEYEQETGQKVQYKDDLKNWFAWFAFEHTTWQLANELELDI